MNIEAKIGNRIKELRDRKGLTQLQLAQKAGLNRTFLIHTEKGRRNISAQSLEKVLKGLDTSFALFFRKFS